MRLSLSSFVAFLAAAGTIAPSSALDTFQQLQARLAPDSADILDNLSSYSKIWIEVPKSFWGGRGNCVWSECGLDDQTDDMHTGDFRDGDGQWYQFRTQGFCANAAFSLYGVKKGHVGSGCSGKTYINSFFTYDGADKLLNAVGKSPEIYWGDAVAQDERRLPESHDANNDFNYGGNAYCVTMENGFDGGRELNSGDARNGGYSSALGCDSHNHYIMAGFKGSACDGNYFLKSLDSMSKYNTAMSQIGCYQIWSNSGASDYSNEAVYALIKDSWACDYRLYPKECPDPFGEKKRYEHALETHLKGGNALMSFHHYGTGKPLQITSWVFLSVALALFGYSYHIKNRIATKGITAEAKDVALALFGFRSYHVKNQIATKGKTAKAKDDALPLFGCRSYIVKNQVATKGKTSKANDDGLEMANVKNQIGTKGKTAKAKDDGLEMANKNGAVEDCALPKAGEKNIEGVGIECSLKEQGY